MENDENLELELEQPIEETGQEEAPEGTKPGEGEEPKKADTIKLTPAQFRHFKKWQEEQSNPPKKVETPQSASSQPSVEETVLLANGMPEELVTQLKKVATLNNTSLIKAQADPIFVAVKEKFEKDQKQKDASLPPSRGSGQVKPKVTPNTPGISRDEHKRLAMEALG